MILLMHTQEFLFSLHNGVADVCVLIYDEDHITDDDLIGSVQVNRKITYQTSVPFSIHEAIATFRIRV